MKRAFLLCLIAGVPLGAQNTQPSFENNQVIINEPHPGVEIAGFPKKLHDHKLNRVMVYVNVGGENLHYQDGHTVALRWQAGDVLWSPASGLHYSEILTTNPPYTGPMLVDVGIKQPGTPGKMVTTPLDGLRIDPKDFQLEFENSQVRVIRVKLAPRQSAPMHEHALNSLTVFLTDANTRVTSAEGKAEVTSHRKGDFVWAAATRHQLENLSDQPFEAVVVEFKN